jgi:hypothetical protein
VEGIIRGGGDICEFTKEKKMGEVTLTTPGDFKCRDCNEQAEEYHHYLGYAPEHWLDVIALCKDCHRQNHQQLRRHF